MRRGLACVFIPARIAHERNLFRFPGLGVTSPLPSPKKLELTKENLNALLGLPRSLNQKPPTSFSRTGARTSGGRGPGTQ